MAGRGHHIPGAALMQQLQQLARVVRLGKPPLSPRLMEQLRRTVQQRGRVDDDQTQRVHHAHSTDAVTNPTAAAAPYSMSRSRCLFMLSSL